MLIKMNDVFFSQKCIYNLHIINTQHVKAESNLDAECEYLSKSCKSFEMWLELLGFSNCVGWKPAFGQNPRPPFTPC